MNNANLYVKALGAIEHISFYIIIAILVFYRLGYVSRMGAHICWLFYVMVYMIMHNSVEKRIAE